MTCTDCTGRCTCTYTCTYCGATRTGRPNHKDGECPDERSAREEREWAWHDEMLDALA